MLLVTRELLYLLVSLIKWFGDGFSSGTKGKGSTCSFVESILREHGFRTGFYSSPHLVAVRERIRINGQPISKEDFISYFWDVYNQLIAKKVGLNFLLLCYYLFPQTFSFPDTPPMTLDSGTIIITILNSVFGTTCTSLVFLIASL